MSLSTDENFEELEGSKEAYKAYPATLPAGPFMHWQYVFIFSNSSPMSACDRNVQARGLQVTSESSIGPA